jgi:hypothetical protein
MEDFITLSLNKRIMIPQISESKGHHDSNNIKIDLIRIFKAYTNNMRTHTSVFIYTICWAIKRVNTLKIVKAYRVLSLNTEKIKQNQTIRYIDEHSICKDTLLNKVKYN